MTARDRARTDGSDARAVSSRVERRCREELLIERGQLSKLRSELLEGVEDGSVRLDAAKLTHLEASAQVGVIETRLASVDAALERLRVGKFGWCGNCGGRIPEERLEARPDAEFCVPCCQRRRRSA